MIYSLESQRLRFARIMLSLSDDIASSIFPQVHAYNIQGVSNAIRVLPQRWFIKNIEGYAELYPDKKPDSAREFIKKLIGYHSCLSYIQIE